MIIEVLSSRFKKSTL